MKLTRDERNFLQKTKITAVDSPLCKVPDRLLLLYRWFHGMKSTEVKALMELKQIYKLVKSESFARMSEKISQGEQLSKKDLDFLKFMKDLLVDLHKLEFGEKHHVEHEVTIADIRNVVLDKSRFPQRSYKQRGETVKAVFTANALEEVNKLEGQGLDGDRDIRKTEQDRDIGAPDTTHEEVEASGRRNKVSVPKQD
jgi:hypothetical protein